jgi:crooked neck
MSTKAVLVVRETFELAVLNVPPVEEKRYWRRYIYLWYAYALFEEVDVEADE